jgi:hypothetical protein
MEKFLTEFIQYNGLLTAMLFMIPWVLGVCVLIESTVVKLIKLYWNDLWKGMNDNKRYTVNTFTFTTKRW